MIENIFYDIRTPCGCEFCYKFKKEPRIGRNHLTVIEALADSAQQSLVHAKISGNFEKVEDRLNRILGFTRGIIIQYPETPDNPRCRFRNTPRMRCNLPLIDSSCQLHKKEGVNGTIQTVLGVIE